MQAVEFRDGRLILLDQRELPHVERYLEIESAAAACDAIRDMVVRGAPAIGLAAAFAMVLAAREAQSNAEPEGMLRAVTTGPGAGTYRVGNAEHDGTGICTLKLIRS